MQFSGNLRGDLFDDMLALEQKTDLCLCLGTSLSGNKLQMLTQPLSISPTNIASPIINLQQTPLDDRCAIRIWAKLDDVFALLAEKLGVEAKPILVR